MKIVAVLIPFVCWGNICIFTPPVGWEPSQPKEISKQVKIGFVGRGSGPFKPSIHLAEEQIDCNLDEYLKAVQRIHLSQPHAQWRNLGRIEMRAGTGQLTEIRNRTPYGEIVLLQAIFLQKPTAYLLTAAVAKDDLQDFRKELLSALASLNVLPDLLTAISKENLRAKFDRFYREIDPHKNPHSEWIALQQMIQNETADLGGYWQFLALQDGYSKIYRRPRN